MSDKQEQFAVWLLFSLARGVIQKSEWLIVAAVGELNNTWTDRWPGPPLTDWIQRNWKKKKKAIIRENSLTKMLFSNLGLLFKGHFKSIASTSYTVTEHYY